MLITLAEVNIAQKVRASLGEKDNNLPRLHCEKKTRQVS
jgi:hypothetical protein